LRRLWSIEVVACLLAALLFLTFSVLPADAVVGVKTGDWAKYSIGLSWDTSISVLPTPDLAEFEWVKYEVKNVTVDYVSALVTWHSKNGTETSKTLTVNVVNQTGDIRDNILVQADIKEGDNVGVWASYAGNSTSLPINETISRYYLGAFRQVNHVDATYSASPYEIHFVGYWDKATGIACEIAETFHAHISGQNVDFSLTFTLTETNMWNPTIWTQWWLWTAVLVITCIAVACALLVKRSRQHKAVATKTSPHGETHSFSATLQTNHDTVIGYSSTCASPHQKDRLPVLSTIV
jgi:hypothetical protein